MLAYWFYPNPGNSAYFNPKVIVVLLLIIFFFFLSFAVSYWRNRLRSPITKKLSKSWAKGMRWFGFIGLLLVVSRVEDIQFLAMRVLWIVWLFSFIGFVMFQIWQFRKRHYTVLKNVRLSDPMEKYLPKK